MADPHALMGDPALKSADGLILQLKKALDAEQRYLDNLPQEARYGFSAHQVLAAERNVKRLRDQLTAAEKSKQQILTRTPEAGAAARSSWEQPEQYQGSRALELPSYAQPLLYSQPLSYVRGEPKREDLQQEGIKPEGVKYENNHHVQSISSDSSSLHDSDSSSDSLLYIPRSMAPSINAPERLQSGNKRTLSNARESLDPTSPGRSKRPALNGSRRSSTGSNSSVMDLTEADDKIEAAVTQKRSKTEDSRQNTDNPVAQLPSFLQQRIMARPEPARPSPPQPAPSNRTAPTWPPPNNRTGAAMRLNASQPAPSGSLAATIQRTSGMDLNTMTDANGKPLDENMQADLQRLLEISPSGASGQTLTIDDEERQRRHIENFIRTAGADIPDDELENTPPGLRYPLYAHQKQALTWMKKQEAGTNKGGILGDDMGLGKTISTLALMIGNAATDACRTTLIVAPLSLVRQWEEEIQNKLLPGYQLSICVFHESNRPTAAELMRFDVVLTTYQTLCSEHKKVRTFWEQAADRNVDQDNDFDLEQSVRLFHPTRGMFYRIVLDEAQMIKNRLGKTSLAAAALMAKHRWCLTGTPMMNSLHEIYPFYRFLHIAPYNDWSIFNQKFYHLKKMAEPGPALNTFRVLLRKTMLRRDKSSEINGQRILQLPEKTEEIIHIELEGEQLQYYKAITENAQVLFNAYLRKGTLGKHYSVMLVQLLRMRQAVCHPHLVLDDEEVQPEGGDETASMELAKTLEPRVVARLIEQVRSVLESLEGFDCPVCLDKIPNPAIPFPCGHYMCAPCLRAHIENCERDNIRHGENARQTRCAVCRDPLQTEKVITFSTFKKVHMPELVQSDEGENENGDKETDDSDSDEFSGEDDSDDAASSADTKDADDADGRGNLRGFVIDSDDNESSDLDAPSQRTQAKKKATTKTASKKKTKKQKPTGPKRKVKATMLKSLRKSAKRSAQDNHDYRRYLSKHWMSSAKVEACIELIKRIRDESGGQAKTLIFSQWTMFLDLMEIALRKDEELKHVGHVRYDGEMNMKDRFRSAQKFRDTPKTKLMLISLKAGNAGLNLVQASRVIILDPFWNPYIEMQAVDRVHRIGQQSDVKVYRILVKDSVEDRIMEIQNKKRNAIGAALDGKASRSMGLNFEDLRHLFGF